MNTETTRAHEILEKGERPLGEEEDATLDELEDEAVQEYLDGKTEVLDWRDL